MKPGKTGLERIVDATRYSLSGLRFCWQHEAAFRQELILILVLLPISFFVAKRVEQWLLLMLPMVLVLIVELLNTAIEVTVDRIGHEHHELSGRAKDLASAAVFIWLAIIWENYLAQ